MRDMRAEHLDHLVIVAGICRESGLAEYLDALTEASQQQVSAGTATVAMILNGLAFSNRRLNRFEGVSLVTFQPLHGPPYGIWPIWSRVASQCHLCPQFATT